MKIDQDLKYKVVESTFNSYIKRLESFVTIADKKFPLIQHECEIACKKSKRAKRYIEVSLLYKKRISLMRKAWKVMKRNQRLMIRRRGLVRGMLDHFRR